MISKVCDHHYHNNDFSISQYKIDITPLLTHRSYVTFVLIPRYVYTALITDDTEYQDLHLGHVAEWQCDVATLYPVPWISDGHIPDCWDLYSPYSWRLARLGVLWEIKRSERYDTSSWALYKRTKIADEETVYWHGPSFGSAQHGRDNEYGLDNAQREDTI